MSRTVWRGSDPTGAGVALGVRGGVAEVTRRQGLCKDKIGGGVALCL